MLTKRAGPVVRTLSLQLPPTINNEVVKITRSTQHIIIVASIFFVATTIAKHPTIREDRDSTLLILFLMRFTMTPRSREGVGATASVYEFMAAWAGRSIYARLH